MDYLIIDYLKVIIIYDKIEILIKKKQFNLAYVWRLQIEDLSAIQIYEF